MRFHLVALSLVTLAFLSAPILGSRTRSGAVVYTCIVVRDRDTDPAPTGTTSCERTPVEEVQAGQANCYRTDHFYDHHPVGHMGRAPWRAC